MPTEVARVQAKSHVERSRNKVKSAPLILSLSHPTPFKGPPLLLSLEIVEEDRSLLRLLTPVLDDDARAVDDLASVALTVKNAYRY